MLHYVQYYCMHHRSHLNCTLECIVLRMRSSISHHASARAHPGRSYHVTRSLAIAKKLVSLLVASFVKARQKGT